MEMQGRIDPTATAPEPGKETTIMKNTNKYRVLVAVVLAMALSVAVNLAWADTTVLPSADSPYGMNYAQWGATWWQWVVSSRFDNQVLLDTTGKYAHENQLDSSPVFFLGGTWTGAPVTRTVNISASQALFFPIFNWIQTYPDDVPAASRTSLATAEAYMQTTLDNALKIGGSYLTSINQLVVKVDGTSVLNYSGNNPADFYSRYRGTSGPFSMYYPSDSYEVTNDVNSNDGQHYTAGLHYPCYSDGYWVMLAPLSLGKH
jgi:hypothetical protein